MTLEEAKDILKKEFAVINLHKSTEPFEFDDSNWFGYEKPSALEAFYTTISGHDYDMRKKRLKKEYETSTKAPGPGEEQPKEGNPALEESASQFNDALLDEQAKKIAELTKEKANLKDQITVLNACKKHNDKIDRKQIKCLGKEIAKLNGIIHDKNAILSDVAEELRLSKIREKNLVEVSQKYMKENEELKKKLEKMTKLVETVRKGSKEYCEYGIAAEKMIQKMAKEIVNDSPVPSKDYKQYRLWANGYRFNPQLPELSEEEEIRALKLQISALEKRGNGIDWKRNADAIKLYVNRASHERLWNPISQDICNEKELSFIINHGGKRVKYALHFDGTDIVYECSDPDKKSNDLMVGADIAEEGGDNSGVIVLCGKDFIDAIKKMK